MPCFGARQPGLAEHPAERPAVLGEVDRLRRRCRGSARPRPERLRETERRLAAELHDDARDRSGLRLGVHDLEHVLERERLEVQPVGVS